MARAWTGISPSYLARQQAANEAHENTRHECIACKRHINRELMDVANLAAEVDERDDRAQTESDHLMALGMSEDAATTATQDAQGNLSAVTGHIGIGNHIRDPASLEASNQASAAAGGYLEPRGIDSSETLRTGHAAASSAAGGRGSSGKRSASLTSAGMATHFFLSDSLSTATERSTAWSIRVQNPQ